MCASFDVTKVGILGNAHIGKLYPCQNIQEVNHSLHHIGQGWHLVKLQGKTANGSSACWDVNGTKYGVLQDAGIHKLGGCQNISETRFAFDPLFAIPGSQPVAPPYTGGGTIKINVVPTTQKLGLIRTGGSYGGYSFQNHEHPFKFVGSNRYPQQEGNGICANEWSNLAVQEKVVTLPQGRVTFQGSEESINVDILGNGFQLTFPTISFDGSTPIDYRNYIKLALDGSNIYEQWHIWYHKSSGYCVANK